MSRRPLVVLAVVTTAALAALPVALGPLALASNGADGSTYYLDGFDGTTASFTVSNDQGRTFSATYASTTSFKLASLDRYAPVDPCREAAVLYNDYIATNDTVGFDDILSDFIIPTDPCKARIILDRDGITIKSFQPVP